MTDKNQEPIYPPNFDSAFTTLDKVTTTSINKAEEQPPTETDPEQMIMITKSDLKEVVKEAMAETQNTEPAEIVLTVTENAEQPAEKTVEESIQVLTEKVIELTAVVEAANPAPASEPEQASETPTIETVHQEMSDQVAKVDEKIASVMEEVQHSAQQAEETKAHVEATLEEIKVQVTEIVATELATQTAAILPAQQTNGKLENVVAKHMTASTLITNLLILIIVAAGAIFAVLYFVERTKNSQLVENHQAEKAQIIEKYEKIIAEMTKTIQDLSKDLVGSELVSNDNISAAIQKKIERFKTEGMSEAQAIPKAYIDNEVIEEAMKYLPLSVLKQPNVKDLITEQLHTISTFAAKELQKESMPIK